MNDRLLQQKHREYPAKDVPSNNAAAFDELSAIVAPDEGNPQGNLPLTITAAPTRAKQEDENSKSRDSDEAVANILHRINRE